MRKLNVIVSIVCLQTCWQTSLQASPQANLQAIPVSNSENNLEVSSPASVSEKQVEDSSARAKIKKRRKDLEVAIIRSKGDSKHKDKYCKEADKLVNKEQKSVSDFANMWQKVSVATDSYQKPKKVNSNASPAKLVNKSASTSDLSTSPGENNLVNTSPEVRAYYLTEYITRLNALKKVIKYLCLEMGLSSSKQATDARYNDPSKLLETMSLLNSEFLHYVHRVVYIFDKFEHSVLVQIDPKDTVKYRAFIKQSTIDLLAYIEKFKGSSTPSILDKICGLLKKRHIQLQVFSGFRKAKAFSTTAGIDTSTSQNKTN